VANTTNVLPLRSRAESNASFTEYLKVTRELVIAASEHQECFLGRIIDTLNLSRDPAHFPLFSVLFNYEYGEIRKEAAGLEVELVTRDFPYRNPGCTTIWELFLNVIEKRGGEVEIQSDFCTELFRHETIQRWLGHFRTLLGSVLENPEGRIWELPILTDAERKTVVTDWNRTETEFPRNTSINEIFENRAAQTPDSIALEHDTTRWTYQELNERANQLVHTLRATGAKVGSLIGICIERSAEMIIGILAILKVGGAYVPIDPAYPAARRAIMLNGIPLLLTTKKLASEFVDCAVRIMCIDDQNISFASKANLSSLVDGDSLACVIYTSGSSGNPKGVTIQHRAVNRLVLNTNYITLDPSDVVAQTANGCFDVAIFEIWGALLNSARLVVINKDLALSPSSFAREMEQRAITTIWLTTSLFNLMAQHVPNAFANLRNVLFGGEAADPRSVAAILKHGAPRHLVNCYGPTETTTFATCHEVRHVPENTLTIPIGRPISNTTIYVLDNCQNPVPIGIAGEIYIGGPGVARGYFGAPELTAERFIADPFSTESDARLYKTGDLGRWLSDGTIDFLGRIDQQVKIRGFRVEPGEIEAVLEQHPAVDDAVVVVREHAGEEKRLIAYVAGEFSLLKKAELRDFLRSSLPDYMLPSAIVVVEKLPLNANGKIDRRALPEPMTFLSEKASVPPRNSIEAQLVAIWEKVLRVWPIGIDDDFFEIGGDSLLAVRIFLEIEKRLGKKLPLAALFKMPTIERLAQKVQEEMPLQDWTPVAAIQLQGNRLPFFAIHGRDGNVLFYRKLSQCLGTDQPFYALQSQGLDGKPMARLSVETIADYYLQEIRNIRPQGPYMVGGYSFGGVVAYEIAQKLCSAGEEVALLVLFDTLNPTTVPRLQSLAERIRKKINDPSPLTLSRLIQFLARRMQGRMGANLLGWNKMIHKLLLDAIECGEIPLSTVEWSEMTQKLLLERIEKRGQKASEKLLELHVRMVHEHAFILYKPLPYRGKVTLFRVYNQPTDYQVDQDLGWSSVAQGGMEIHVVPGDHESIFSNENAPIVAEKLERCIQSVFPKDSNLT
jgi:amino acid adenylation domain-containing protein